MLFPMGLKVSTTTNPDLEDVLTSEAFIPWSSYKMHNTEVTLLGDEAAILTYSIEAYRPALDGFGDEDKFTALASSVWKKDNDSGRLLLCFHQQTPF